MNDSILKGNEEFLYREKDRVDRGLVAIEGSIKQILGSIRNEVNEELKQNLK